VVMESEADRPRHEDAPRYLELGKRVSCRVQGFIAPPPGACCGPLVSGYQGTWNTPLWHVNPFPPRFAVHHE
jgi:hypothetical protein